jgi:hypothetical protein
MSDPNTDPTAPIPWYQSRILVGILTAVCTQVLARVQAKFHVDLSVFGINANDLASWVLDAVSAIAIAVAAHARVTKPIPPVTFSKPPQAPPPAK